MVSGSTSIHAAVSGGELMFIHTTFRRGGQMTCIGQDVLETDPAVCRDCRSERLEHERLARLTYEDAVIWGTFGKRQVIYKSHTDCRNHACVLR
jgi:hypothetical protein